MKAEVLSDYALQALRVVQYAPLIEVLSFLFFYSSFSRFCFCVIPVRNCSIIDSIILIVIVVAASQEGWLESEFAAFGDRSLLSTSRWFL